MILFLLLLILFYLIDIESDLSEMNSESYDRDLKREEEAERQELLLRQIKKECKHNNKTDNGKKKGNNRTSVYRRSITTESGITYTEEVER